MPSPVSAYCGLYCAACRLYLDTVSGKAPTGDRPEACRGCRSEVMGPWCGKCGLKACARRKGIEFCGQCGEFPCADFIGFRDDRQWPYHVETPENLRTIAEVGEQEWLRRMEAKWRCSSCGAPRGWFDLQCEQCGKPVPGYVKPAGA